MMLASKLGNTRHHTLVSDDALLGFEDQVTPVRSAAAAAVSAFNDAIVPQVTIAKPSAATAGDPEAAPESGGGTSGGPQFLGDAIGDTIATASTLALNTAFAGVIDNNTDVDVFRVTLEAGQTYTFTLEKSVWGTPLDPFLELRDAGGVIIDSDDDGATFANAQLTFTATTSGDYFLFARSFSNFTNGSYVIRAREIDTGNTSPTTFTPNGLDQYSWDQAAIQIVRGSNGSDPNDQGSWAPRYGQPVVVTYAFRSSAPGVMPDDTAGFSRFNAAQIAAAEAALAAWASVANIVFQRVQNPDGYSNDAALLFGNYNTGAEGAAAFAFIPTNGNADSSSIQGDVWVNVSDPSNANPVMGEYGPHALLHEIGHAIGLHHPGEYNAGDPGGDITYETHAEYYNDSRMFTVMSYFGSLVIGGSLPAFASLPQLHDIAAAQLLYGANMNTRTGDTTYGFNSNAGSPEYLLDSASDGAVFAIWDAGGTDTLDLSGYTTSSTIDLREEGFSSAGPGNGSLPGAFNIAIARGAIIENAVGGSGNDTIIGNAQNNVINGGAGVDSMRGGVGDDTYIVDNSSDVVVELSGEGNDTVLASANWIMGAQIENLTLTGSAISGIGNGEANVITGNALANTLFGQDGADTLDGGDGADTLTGGGGVDIILGGDGDDIINYNFGEGVDAVINGGNGADRVVTMGNAGGETLDAHWNGTVFTFIKGTSVVSIEQATADLGGGVDWLRQFNSTQAVTINLALGTAAGFISIANIENAWGTGFNDTLIGSSVANTLRGAAGDDQIDGGDGADLLIGEDGLDTITGGLGADTIYGLSGADTVNGGDGDDIIYYSFGEGVDGIDGGDGVDTIICQGNSGAETLEVAWDGTSFTFFKGGAVTSIEQAQANMGVGGDWVRFTNSSVGVTIDLGANTASGFTSLLSVENASGGAFDDTITGSGVANNLVGNAGADTINGAGGNDTINGGAGVDMIIGGAGSDTLIGGGDADTFVFATGSGVDSIADFDANPNGGQDLLDISGYGITTGDFGARVTIQDQGANTLITIDGTNTILLQGVTGDGNNVITQADFLLA